MHSNITRTHPKLNQFRDWYDDENNKRFPLDTISLSPLVLKIWYVCDGYLNTSNPKPRARISSINESDRIEKIAEWITEETGIEVNTSKNRERILFNTRRTQKFFEYVGDPLPGFVYKWPETY